MAVTQIESTQARGKRGPLLAFDRIGTEVRVEMGFYIRKGFNFGPLRLNLSRSGVGASFGVPPTTLPPLCASDKLSAELKAKYCKEEQ